jgi:hypothetical protein
MPRLLTAAAQKKENLEKVFLSAAHGESDFKFIEAAAGEEGKKLKTFSMVGYTGGAMRVGYGYPVVVDLAGMDVPTQRVPILKDHNPTAIVAHSTEIEKMQKRIKLAGVISGVGEAAQEVQALAANEFPWQASIGASIERMEFVERGESVTVNGQSFTGPLYVARKSKLVEVSFVAIGADTSTSARVAASHHGEGQMNEFEKWLQAMSLDVAALSDESKTALKAKFDAEQKTKTEPEPKPIKAADGNEDDPVLKIRAAQSAEYARIGKIEITAKGHPDIIASAIEGNWDEARVKSEVELKTLRASRPQSPGIHVLDKSVNSEVIEAALCKSRRIPGYEKSFKPEVLEAADRNLKRVGLQQVIILCASANGCSIGPGEGIHRGNFYEVIRAAMTIQAAGFSTLSLPGILSNVANKEILAGYMEEDQTWRRISRIKSVNDFKQATSYRLLDNMEYEELAPDGRMKQGSVSEESYTRQVKTYAKLFALTRTDIINDDAGAFDDLKNRVGRGGAKKFNNLFWTNFMDNSTFFTAARVNYITGATTNLGTDGVGLTAGVLAFDLLKSGAADGAKRIGGVPKLLLVPPELRTQAEILYKNMNLTAVKASDANIHAGKYEPVVVPWLSDSAFAGYSSTAWYLLREAMDMAPMVVSFLDGVETPTVETGPADFDQLGIQFRGYHDFGADRAEYLAGIKSKGAA